MARISINRIGYVFQPAQRFAGWILIVAGLITAYLQSPIALLISVVGVMMALLKKFVHIDTERHRIRISKSFTSYLPRGKWHGLQNYPFVTLIRRVLSSSVTNYGGQQSGSTGSNTYYDVLLLSNSHRSKIVINRLMDKDAAWSYAEEMARVLAREVVPYKPQKASPRPQQKPRRSASSRK
jgi:hypothetical protein